MTIFIPNPESLAVAIGIFIWIVKASLLWHYFCMSGEEQ